MDNEEDLLNKHNKDRITLKIISVQLTILENQMSKNDQIKLKTETNQLKIYKARFETEIESDKKLILNPQINELIPGKFELQLCSSK